MQRCGLVLAAASFIAGATAASAETEYRAAVLRVDAPGPLPISRLDLSPEDLGFAGAALGTADNATTGSFMQQKFATETVVATPETAEAEMRRLLDAGIWWVVVLADADTTVRLADVAGDKALVLNAKATDDRLRGEDCRANLLHVAPSDAMLADALAQYLVWKRWGDWLLIEGSHPVDQALAEAYRRAATYVDRILKGARPADLPVEQGTRFDLVVNAKSARALGVPLPNALVMRADHLVQ